MRFSDPKRIRSSEAGFSMVELLMTAFVLAVGILGLTMLQVMSLRASRGSRSLTTAIQVAERVMDQVEMEGRLSWLDLTNPQGAASTLDRKYIGTCTSTVAVADTFDINGDPPSAASPVFFTSATLAPQTTASVTGTVTDFRVSVTFTESIDASNTPVTRNIVLTRRVLHG
jgi:Tfp pilus assembly protein PilV